MVQMQIHTNNQQIGYIMFENLENEEDPNRLQTKSNKHGNKHHGEQGETVESIMSIGFSGTRLDMEFESHAYCMKQKYPDKHTKDNDG
eukprot:9015534-Heterocapsa_arctica.AAC.1